MTSRSLWCGASLALPLCLTGSPAAQEGGWHVDLRVDEARRSAVLGELAQHRRVRDHDAFRAVLEGWKSELALEQQALRAELEVRGAEVSPLWLTGDLAVRTASPETVEWLRTQRRCPSGRRNGISWIPASG